MVIVGNKIDLDSEEKVRGEKNSSIYFFLSFSFFFLSFFSLTSGSYHRNNQ